MRRNVPAFDHAILTSFVLDALGAPAIQVLNAMRSGISGSVSLNLIKGLGTTEANAFLGGHSKPSWLEGILDGLRWFRV